MLKEIVTENFVVRVHEGKLSEDERREVIKSASERLFQAVQDADADSCGNCNMPG